jgi:hypothetical protein
MAAAQIIHGKLSLVWCLRFCALIFGANVPSLPAKGKSPCRADARFWRRKIIGAKKYAGGPGVT